MFKLSFCLFCFSLTSHFVTAFSEVSIVFDSVRLEEKAGNFFVVHEVEQGETLFSLSQRYTSPVSDIQLENNLQQNGIDIGQILMIPVTISQPVEIMPANFEKGTSHIVQPKETLYSIARKYNIHVDELKGVNDLASNNLDIGQVLMVPKKRTSSSELTLLEGAPQQSKLPEGPKYTYYVQPGETISSIARRFEVNSDSIISWNQLNSSQLKIGSQLIIRQKVNLDSLNYQAPSFSNTSYGSKMWHEENDAPGILWEEGVAGVIEEILKTKKHLALHRELPVGSEVSVVNLMNNKRILVKVVGKLPETGLNRNVMIRLTPVTFRKLGIVDRRSRVKISYMRATE